MLHVHDLDHEEINGLVFDLDDLDSVYEEWNHAIIVVQWCTG
jgi:hypothetical protein